MSSVNPSILALQQRQAARDAIENAKLQLKTLLSDTRKQVYEDFKKPVPTSSNIPYFDRIVADAGIYKELPPPEEAARKLQGLLPSLNKVRNLPLVYAAGLLPFVQVGFLVKPKSRTDLPDYLVTTLGNQETITLRGYVRHYLFDKHFLPAVLDAIKVKGLPRTVPWDDMIDEIVQGRPQPRTVQSSELDPNAQFYHFDWEGNAFAGPTVTSNLVCLNYAGVTSKNGTRSAVLGKRVAEDLERPKDSFLGHVLDSISEIVPKERRGVSVSLVFEATINAPTKKFSHVYIRSNIIADNLERVLILGLGPLSLNSAIGGHGYYSSIDSNIGSALNGIISGLGKVDSHLQVFSVPKVLPEQRQQKRVEVRNAILDTVASLNAARDVQVGFDVNPALEDATKSPYIGHHLPGLLVLSDPTFESTTLKRGFFSDDLSSSGGIYFYRWLAQWFPEQLMTKSGDTGLDWKVKESRLHSLIAATDTFPTLDKDVDEDSATIVVDGLKKKIQILSPHVLGIVGSMQSSLQLLFNDKDVSPLQILGQVERNFKEQIFKPNIMHLDDTPYIVHHFHHPGGGQYHPEMGFVYNNLVSIGLAIHVLLMELVERHIVKEGATKTRYDLLRDVLSEFKKVSQPLMALGEKYSKQYYDFQKIKNSGPLAAENRKEARRRTHATLETLAPVEERNDQLEDLIERYQYLVSLGEVEAASKLVNKLAPPVNSPLFREIWDGFSTNQTGKTLRGLFGGWFINGPGYNPKVEDQNYVARGRALELCTVEYELFKGQPADRFRRYFCVRCGKISHGTKMYPRVLLKGCCPDGKPHSKECIKFRTIYYPFQLQEEVASTYEAKSNDVDAEAVPVKALEVIPAHSTIFSNDGFADTANKTTIYLGGSREVQDLLGGVEEPLFPGYAKTVALGTVLSKLPPTEETDFAVVLYGKVDRVIHEELVRELPVEEQPTLEELKETLADEWFWLRVDVLYKLDFNGIDRVFTQETNFADKSFCVWECNRTPKPCKWWSIGNGSKGGAFSGDLTTKYENNTTHKVNNVRHNIKQIPNSTVTCFSEFPRELQVTFIIKERKQETHDAATKSTTSTKSKQKASKAKAKAQKKAKVEEEEVEVEVEASEPIPLSAVVVGSEIVETSDDEDDEKEHLHVPYNDEIFASPKRK